MNAKQPSDAWLVTAAREHWLPLLLLVVPIFLAVWGAAEDVTLLLLVVSAVALVIGYLLRPHRTWLVWLGAIVVQWIAMGVLPEGETVLSLILEAPNWMAGGVLLPAWLGRTIRAALQHNGATGATPHEPAP